MKTLREKVEALIVGRARPHGQEQSTGQQAETMAADYLRKQGLTILARNQRFPQGELDLICRDGNTLVFVEVRLRQNNWFGGAAASITPAKQRRLTLAARQWLLDAGRQHIHSPCRFDAILMDRLNPACIEWIRNAFDAHE